MNNSPKSIEERLSNVEAKVRETARFELFVKSITLLGAAIAFGWGLYQYFETSRNEFRKAFWEKRYSLYSRATCAASKIALARNLDSVHTERAEFWSLYWGELSIVESKAVQEAMVAYGKNLTELELKPEAANGLKQLSYRLARACRDSLKATWEPAPLDDIPSLKTDWNNSQVSGKVVVE
ncbi:MAG: hypothetical protein U0930_13660 [Pirellulales bacterium]